MRKKGAGSLFQKLFKKSPGVTSRSQEIMKGGKAESAGQRSQQRHEGNESLQSRNASRTPREDAPEPNRLEETIVEQEPPRQEDAHRPDQEGDSSRPIDIVAGVDLGTSSTKVVVQLPYLAGKPAFAVPFDDLAHKSLEYLLPTRLFIGKDDVCSLARISESLVKTDIKVGLMEAKKRDGETVSGQIPPITIATLYLGLVLQHTRRWFIENKKDIYGGSNLRWSWNLGLPAAVDDDDGLREDFEIVGNAAWLLSGRPSGRPGYMTIAAASKAIDDVRNTRLDAEDPSSEGSESPPEEFGLVPEVVAQAVGYARSRHRNEGLHLLIDIGASTLDVCSFNLGAEDGNDRYSILTADVEMLGAKRLHLSRVEGGRKAVSVHAASLIDENDPVSMIPEDARDYAPTEEKIGDEVVNTEDSFRTNCKKLLRRTLSDLKRRRYPAFFRNPSPHRPQPLPVFVCGGARSMQIYQDVVSLIDKWLKQFASKSHNARVLSLPKPESLEADIDDHSYHRLTVAWGLSHERINIGDYVRPGGIEDVPPPQVRTDGDRFVDKDKV